MLRELAALAAGGRDLTAAETAAAMRAMASGEESPALTAAFLTALHMKGETAEEVAGFARVMREFAVRVSPACERLVDTCGTGGGSVPTFNISTTAAFVVAGAGVPVAKHGNRAMTSRVGSADVLEALGARIDLPPERVCELIETTGIGFLFAQAHHPAMRHLAPVRRELPFRTVFNCLGPLTNPAGAAAQVAGVYTEALVPLLAEALGLLGCRRALVVYGRDGLDEISTLGPTLVAEVGEGGVSLSEWTPEQFGLERASPEEIAPGEDAPASAAIARSVLSGRRGAPRDIVLLNAAAALVVAGAAPGVPEGLRLAAESVDSGAALARLDAFVAGTRS